VVISFADQGIGFDEKYTDRIFKPFQRLNPSGRYPGTGIGLAICRKIVERHGGVLGARSAPGEGATFTASMPLSNQRADEGDSEGR
jgi:signal transduction histidine kinase